MVKSAETVRCNAALQQTFTRKETTPWVVFNAEFPRRRV